VLWVTFGKELSVDTAVLAAVVRAAQPAEVQLVISSAAAMAAASAAI
jgi:hypothetical protein